MVDARDNDRSALLIRCKAFATPFDLNNS